MPFLVYDRPVSICMLFPILISIHITSITFVRVVGISSIFLFSIGNSAILQNDYYELWAICIYLVFYIVFLSKDILVSKHGKDPPRLVDDQSYIYNREFKNEFTLEEFKTILMKSCDVRRHKGNKKLFITEGGHFNSIYYFVSIPKNAFVTLRHQNTVISYLQDSSWIGIVEFVSQIFDDSKRSWIVGLECENSTDDEIVWLEWNKDYFHKIFKKHKNTSFTKKLLVNWTRYLSLSTYKMDDHISTALKILTDSKTEDFPQALPLFRGISGINPQFSSINDELEEFPEKKTLLNDEFPI